MYEPSSTNADALSRRITPAQSHDARLEPCTPAVSIVLPVHNGEAYLREALDSILAQSFADFELIAVDDCSSDSSPAILAKYAASDPRVQVITLAENRKLPGALNTGFAAAKADWFTWTSDDNLLLPSTLQELIAERDANPGADILYADYRVIDAEGHPGRRVNVEASDNILTSNCVRCCFLYRRTVDERLGGYDEGLFGVEDYDFWLRAARAGFVFHPINRELYLYRRHERSLTDRRAEQIRQMVADVLEREIPLHPQRSKRARAWFALFVSNPYSPRPRHLARALAANPLIGLLCWRDLIVWAKRAIVSRLK